LVLIRFIVCLICAVSLLFLSIPFISSPFITKSFAQEAHQAEETPSKKPFEKLKGLWAAIAIFAGCFGTGWAQSRVGTAGSGALAEKPEVGGIIIVLMAIPETMIILAFVIAIMILTM